MVIIKLQSSIMILATVTFLSEGLEVRVACKILQFIQRESVSDGDPTEFSFPD